MSFHFKEIIWRLPWSLCLVNCSFPLYILIFPALKWNESGFRPPLCTYRLNWARRTSCGWWMRWLCPPDTGFEIRALAVWGRARYLSVTEAPHNTEFHTWMGKFFFVSFKPPRPGTEPRTLAWKAAVLTTTLWPPPFRLRMNAEWMRNVPCVFAGIHA